MDEVVFEVLVVCDDEAVLVVEHSLVE